MRRNADEWRRRAERDAARTGAQDDLVRDLVARMRAGVVNDDALQTLARIGYAPAQELAGHGRALRAGPNRDKLLTDPVERAFETLGEVAELADGGLRSLLWPLGAAAMLLSAERSVVSQRIRSRRIRLETALISARETVEDALAVARGDMPQMRGDPPETTRPVDSVWSLMQASAALRRSLRPHGHRSDINEVAYNAVNACGRMSHGTPQVAWRLAGRMGFTVDAQNAVHVARAVTEAVVPAILAGDVMASPLLSRPLPWQTQANRPRRRNMDEDMRSLERLAETGDQEAQARLMAARLRAGELREEAVRLGALLGRKDACVVTGLSPLTNIQFSTLDMRGMQLERHSVLSGREPEVVRLLVALGKRDSVMWAYDTVARTLRTGPVEDRDRDATFVNSLLEWLLDDSAIHPVHASRREIRALLDQSGYDAESQRLSAIFWALEAAMGSDVWAARSASTAGGCAANVSGEKGAASLELSRQRESLAKIILRESLPFSDDGRPKSTPHRRPRR